MTAPARFSGKKLVISPREALVADGPAEDLDHTIQAERALMQPFIEASGPWRRSHADHDAVVMVGGPE